MNEIRGKFLTHKIIVLLANQKYFYTNQFKQYSPESKFKVLKLFLSFAAIQQVQFHRIPHEYFYILMNFT